MTKYLENMRVLSEENKVVAIINTRYDRSRRNFDDCDVVFRTTVKQGTINDVGEFMVGYIYNNPEKFQSKGDSFKFGFPCLGGAVIEVKPTGENFTEFAYVDMVFVISLTLAAAFKKHLCYMFGRKEDQGLLSTRVDEIMQEIIDAKCKVAEQGENARLNLAGYEKIKAFAVES